MRDLWGWRKCQSSNILGVLDESGTDVGEWDESCKWYLVPS